MKILTGTVVAGEVVVRGHDLPEGAVVTILAAAGDGGFELCPEDEKKLREAIAQIEAGDVVDGHQLLDD